MSPAKKGRVDVDETREVLNRLGLMHAGDLLSDLLNDAAKEEMPPHRFLDRVLHCELSAREERRVRTSLRLSGLPTRLVLVGKRSHQQLRVLDVAARHVGEAGREARRERGHVLIGRRGEGVELHRFARG